MANGLDDVTFADILYGLWLPELKTIGEGHPLWLFLREVNASRPDPYRIGDLLIHVWRFILGYEEEARGLASNVEEDPLRRQEGARKWATARLTKLFLERLRDESVTPEAMEKSGKPRPLAN